MPEDIAPKDAAPKRMTLSQVVEHLLTRGSSQSSSVSLTRNAKGETQIEVVVRTDAELDIRTPDDAAEVAGRVYDSLRTSYPFGAEPQAPEAGA
jgi:hypothetical protein